MSRFYKEFISRFKIKIKNSSNNFPKIWYIDDILAIKNKDINTDETKIAINKGSSLMY